MKAMMRNVAQLLIDLDQGIAAKLNYFQGYRQKQQARYDWVPSLLILPQQRRRPPQQKRIGRNIMRLTKTLVAIAVLNIAAAGALTLGAGQAQAAGHCSDGEIHIKFSHVTNTDKHPKGIAATLLEKRVYS